MLVGRMSLASRTTRRARCVCTHRPPTMVSTPKNETRVDPRRQSGVVESHLALGHLVVHEILEALARGLRHLLKLFAVGRRSRQRERVRVLHPNPVQTPKTVTTFVSTNEESADVVAAYSRRTSRDCSKFPRSRRSVEHSSAPEWRAAEVAMQAAVQ